MLEGYQRKEVTYALVKKTRVLKITLFVSIILMACDNNPEGNGDDPEDIYDVYVAGSASNDDIFVAGYEQDSVLFSFNALYWKNGVKIPIPSFYIASAITVCKNDIFIAGGGGSATIGMEPTWYWINGTGKVCNETGEWSNACEILVVEK